MQKADPFAHDPFFKRGPDRHWNACIGSQGDEHNYVIGYMQAATELANVVLDKQLFGKIDTLVLPILYNARHAIELVLKFSARRLVEAGVVKGAVRFDHNVQSLWRMLDEAQLGDRMLVQCITALTPFIDSVAAIDRDGQELRYHRNNLDDPSLAKYSIASLEIIRDSLDQLAKIIDELQWRTVEFLRERNTGTFTTRCSRLDLFEIAAMLPPLARWNEPVFDDAREKIRAEFNLTSNAFSKALGVIKAHREMRSHLGAETPLLHLTDELVIASLREWRKWHPPRGKSDLEVVRARDITFEDLIEYGEIGAEVVRAIGELLTPDQFGELAAMFFLGRDGYFSEEFPCQAEMATSGYLAHDDRSVEIVYLFNKTNLLADVTRGAEKLGRLTLAQELLTL